MRRYYANVTPVKSRLSLNICVADGGLDSIVDWRGIATN